MGRTPELAKLSDEQRALILAEIRRGASPKAAAALANVHESNWYRWMQAGEEGREPYADFAKSVAIATEAFRADCEHAIASAQDWKARAWILERRHRKDYGAGLKIDGEFRTKPEDLSDEELAAIIASGRSANPE